MDLKLALFDLDGTLVDTAPDFLLAANALRAEFKLSPLESEVISQVVSNGSIAVTEVALETTRETAGFETLRKTLLDHYAHYLGAASTIYPTMYDTLNRLEQQSIPWGVVTNKPVAYAEPLLDKLGLSSQLNCVALVCPDHVATPKPDPQGILKVCTQLNIDSKHCVYVGDHIRDIEAAKNANAISIAAGYGYLASDENPNEWGADHTVESPEKLSQLLQELFISQSI